VRRQLPNISGFVNKSIMDLKKELEAMVGGRAGAGRGARSKLSRQGGSDRFRADIAAGKG